MSFLLDTDTCSAYLKNDRRVHSRFMLHFGGLSTSVITIGEVLTWALRAKAPLTRIHGVQDLVKAVDVLDLDLLVAQRFGEIRADLFDRGLVVAEMDLLNAATAIVHNLTLVTHNTQNYANIPGLALDDWLVP
jgi:predicted nucleic acid-binding protein